MIIHVAVTSVLKDDDSKKFKLSFPREVWSTMTRCWEVSPTSDRIKEDIYAFAKVLEEIIKAKRCIVPDENFRSGKRDLKSKGKGLNKEKTRKRQRISTMMDLNLHPDAKDALESIRVQAFQAVQREKHHS